MERSLNKMQGKNRESKPGKPKTKKTSGNPKESKRTQSQPTIDQFFRPLTSNETSSHSVSKNTSSQQLKQTGTKETPTDFFDNKKDIATTKHGILSSYLGAWLVISSRSAANLYGPLSYSRLVYLDGFAGPGRYNESDDAGSPLVAYTLALTHKNLPEDGPEIDMIFIEKKKIFH